MKKAGEGLEFILVDCTKANPLAKKYGVKGLPTVLFEDPDGKVVGHLQDRSPAGVARQFKEIHDKYGKYVPWMKTIDAAIKKAKKEGKPVLAFFTDEKKSSKDAECVFIDKGLKKTLESFVLVKHVIEKKCPICKKYRAHHGTLILVFDPEEAHPARSYLEKLTGKKTAKSLRRSLESALRRFERKKEEEKKKDVAK